MTLTNVALNSVDQHWAVSALDRAIRDRALEVAKVRLVRSAVDGQMQIDFEEEHSDVESLHRAATAYEVAAIEGIEELLHPSPTKEGALRRDQAQAGAFRAYQIRRSLPVPSNDEERVFHILHLAALAYLGDSWTDLRRWLHDHEEQATAPSAAGVSWDRQLLFRIFDCWIRLLRKNGWDDLDGVREIVTGLRSDQAEYENQLLSDPDDASSRALAYRLISLYHWARATEMLAIFMLQGEPTNIDTELDKHFEAARKAAIASQDAALDVLTHWLHVTSRRMVAGSLWWVARAVNSRVTKFVESATRRGMFELLPPQRAAIQERALLDPATRAIVVELPTSGGKTALAEFRILQALNQFDADKGWVAYVAPTRALVAQLTRRLRQDFGPLGIRVEQLTGAIEIDSFEEAMLSAGEDQVSFHILVSTPEKLHLVIRNKKVARPLALVVMDEAQNIEDTERGLRIELLLATIKRDCASASFLLLMPHVPNADQLASWLAQDACKTISMSTSAWEPNERIVGLFYVEKEDSVGAGWTARFETLVTTPKTIHLRGKHQVGPPKPLNRTYSQVKDTLLMQAGAMAKVFSQRGTSVAVALTIPNVWSMARTIAADLDPIDEIPDKIGLVQRFLSAEISPKFELIEMLGRGVGVHHAGLSDETRALIEWLAELGQLRVLCATTTIAQGINFPVSSVFMASYKYPYGKEMPKRAFWNLAGRAGRINQESVGVVGLAAGADQDAVRQYVGAALDDLVSRLIALLDEVEKAGRLQDLSLVIQEEQWADFRCYVAHLWAERQNLNAVLTETEQLLRNTFGYGVLHSGDPAAQRKAQALLDATAEYARGLANHPENATLADATGFAPEGVAAAIAGLNQLERRLTPADWQPSSLFGPGGASSLSQLVGVMMRIPQIKRSLDEISSEGLEHKQIAELTQAWVSGTSIAEIAAEFFRGKRSDTDAITNACKAIYQVLTNSGPWGISALAKMPTSGIDFDSLSPDDRRRINNLSAMIYHGVQTESAVLMRMNSVPRSVAERLGAEFNASVRDSASSRTPGIAREFLRALANSDWDRVVPERSSMTGGDYREVWCRLSGESSE